MSGDGAIRFTVSYRLGEYREVVRDHMSQTVPHVRSSRLARVFTAVFIPLVFALKKRKVGDCEFVIDDAGVRRRAKDGDVLVEWQSVTAIHRYSSSYLIEKNKGAMPIPYRCLDAAQRDRLEQLLRRWEAN